MKAKRYWETNLEKVLEDRDGMFGHNIDWDIKDVRKYVKKLEKLGCSDFKFPDYYTIEMNLPSTCDMGEPLLFILKNSIKPSEVHSKWNEKLEYFKLTMEFHY